MRKFNLTSQELKALYPHMSDAFDNTVQNTLYDLAHGKEQPKVKKKISATLVIAVILILLTLSAAIALTQSNLLSAMFGHEQVPRELEDIVSKPEATVTTADVKVTLAEYLYDGEKLHLYWTIANQTDRQIMVTMNPFRVNGKDVNTDGIPPLHLGVHAWGQILGGEVDGRALPGSINYYGIYINPWEEPQMYGYHTFARGETVEITSTLYIWELLSAPDPVIFNISQIHEGFLDVKALRGVPTDRSGSCGLGWLLLNDNSIDIYNAKENQSTYEKNGWARMIFEQPVKFSIALDTKSLKQAEPVKTVFETDDFTLDINRLAYMSTGGTLVVHVCPKAQALETNNDILGGYEFVVLDADTKELLSNRTPFVAGGPDYTDYHIVLKPVLGEMPKAILIVPSVYNPKLDKHSESYDPKASPNPYNDSFYEYVMEDAVKVELK